MIDMRKYLYELIEILTQCKIRYFLTSGTLLGLVREGDFIQGDMDIDLGIFFTDLTPIACQNLKKLLHKKNWTIC
jgi:phosphorylcholine metabolism protein LicD